MMFWHHSNVFFFKFTSEVPPAKAVVIVTAILVSYRQITMERGGAGRGRGVCKEKART